jgi:carbamoyltransferase
LISLALLQRRTRNSSVVSASEPLIVGLSGSGRSACATSCNSERVIGICSQERITRVRGAGFNSSGLPDEALDEVLGRAVRQRKDVTTYAFADASPPPGIPNGVHLDHHLAHACSAFLPSPFESSAIFVCDHESPQISVWDGVGQSVTRAEWPWHGVGFAELYSRCAEVLGFAGSEHRMEALARLDPDYRSDWATNLFTLGDDRLEIVTEWRERVAANGAGPHKQRANAASALQCRIGDLLVEFLSMVRRRMGDRRQLCAGGSLFYNSHFNSRVRGSGIFDEVFVPVDPGNAGLSVGAALHASPHRRLPVSPFLGPAYVSGDIKATLDNCKLTYQWLSESDTLAMTIRALQKGQLVGWFEGPMECGPRALGGRSILASPFSQYVLDNLNRFLKHRDPWRGYALSGLASAVADHFNGPSASPFMECDYTPRDRARFEHVIPGPRGAVRVQTVGKDGPPRFRALLGAFGDATGLPVLVNTSFNGFREPIVCSPRDAVRVFFGTGIDMLVFGQLVLTK